MSLQEDRFDLAVPSNHCRFVRPSRLTVGLSLFVAWLLACPAGSGAASVPDWYRKQAKDQPAFPELLANPLAYDGRIVILGGTIARSEKTEGVFRVQIVEKPLSKAWGSYRPKKGETSAGCFYAIIPGFVDHSDFVRGTDMTIAGTLRGAQPGQLGAGSSLFPVVRASWMRDWNGAHKQWEERTHNGSGGMGMGGMGMGMGGMGMGGMGGMYGGPMGMYGPMGMGPWY